MMPFEIIRNDLANMTADAIVNTANPNPVIGAGTDAAIHLKAGPALLEARKKIGKISVGHCAITPAFGLDAKYVIHTVGPVWQGGNHQESQLLQMSYRSALETALEYGCSSVAFPLISAGSYGFPPEEALHIAVNTFSQFLLHHEMHIYLVVWSKEAFRLSRNLFQNVRSFIDDHYVEETGHSVYRSLSGYSFSDRRREIPIETYTESRPSPTPFFSAAPCGTVSCAPKNKSITKASAKSISSSLSLDELLLNTDAGFTETLLKLIDETGKKDSDIYKKANVSKQHFSKIRNNPDYKPTKATAVAFAIALELDLEQTKDLIGRAGYALTNSSKFDVIIMYFISKKNFNMFDINMTLFQFDQMTLGV